MKVWLDDVRPMPFDYDVHFVNAESLIEYMVDCVEREDFPITHISFDHDLGENLKTGYDVACEIERYAYFGYTPRITWAVHSANPVGKKNITRAMQSAERWWNKDRK